MSTPKLKVDIWSDVVCPWCYVGKRRFEKALDGFAHRDDVELTWHSFELDPSAPKTFAGKQSQAERLARKYQLEVPEAQQMLDRMTATGAADGVTFDFARSKSGNTFDAHRLLHLAHARGKQNELKERLMRGYFSEGEPIGDNEALARLAIEVGLDEKEVRALLAGDQYADAVRADEKRAAELGIRGVPYFVVDGKYGLSGAQPPALLGEVLERAWSEASAAPVKSADGPACDSDGCA